VTNKIEHHHHYHRHHRLVGREAGEASKDAISFEPSKTEDLPVSVVDTVDDTLAVSKPREIASYEKDGRTQALKDVIFSEPSKAEEASEVVITMEPSRAEDRSVSVVDTVDSTLPVDETRWLFSGTIAHASINMSHGEMQLQGLSRSLRNEVDAADVGSVNEEAPVDEPATFADSPEAPASSDDVADAAGVQPHAADDFSAALDGSVVEEAAAASRGISYEATPEGEAVPASSAHEVFSGTMQSKVSAVTEAPLQKATDDVAAPYVVESSVDQEEEVTVDEPRAVFFEPISTADDGAEEAPSSSNDVVADPAAEIPQNATDDIGPFGWQNCRRRRSTGIAARNRF
jgi:hypothetical protein